MFITRGDTGNGRSGIIFTDGKRFMKDTLSEKDQCLVSDPQAFFEYLRTGYDEGRLIEIPEPRSYLTPSPVERIFLPAVNFRAHSAESSMRENDSPYFFLKFKSSLVNHKGISYIPRNVKQYDYEGEIAIVIGKKGKYLTKKDAGEVVFGYSIVNDLSVRDYQMTEFPRYGKNWVLGKAGDFALPYGPWILLATEVESFEFTIRTYVNGEKRQDGSTKDMIFSVEELIAEMSKVTTLRPGDIITTGTPSGVAVHSGKGFLKDGDMVEVEVPKIGKLETTIKKEDSNNIPY
ncbi:MAG TPA: fumarylacetoacetate hydrolase family protein [Thermoplasmataceae archaeon]|nr:fumarylacetoacetate hydrolase family protein [Thermoplasmataceae archaeon]